MEHEAVRFSCGTAARWLPRTLAAAMLFVGMFTVARLQSEAPVYGVRMFRILLVVAAAAAALWIVRKGGELRLIVSFAEDRVDFELGSRSAGVAYEEIDAVGYEAPFGPSRSWLPAAVLLDRQGRAWRLSALLSDGGRLVDEFVRRSGREDLAAWIDAQNIRSKMSRSAMRIRIGYSVVLVVLSAGLAFYVR
jgi:hypothetical protein